MRRTEIPLTTADVVQVRIMAVVTTVFVLGVLALSASGQQDGPTGALVLEKIGGTAPSAFDEGAAEISAWDPASQRLFVTNAGGGTVEVLDLHDPTAPVALFSIDLSPFGDHANSVAVRNGLVAVAVEADVKSAPGAVVFFDVNGTLRGGVPVGSQPDMLTFTPNGRWLLVANEGEPETDYSADPAGSISIIPVQGDVTKLTSADVVTAGFEAFDVAGVPEGVRISGPSPLPSQDIEPEYIAVAGNSRTAFVTLQENNAVAVVDILQGEVLELLPLGTKDHDTARVDDLELHSFTNLPLLGTTAAGQDILLGGFSGLLYEGKDDQGRLKFLTHPDRGPNPEPLNVDGDAVLERPFALPDYQARWVRFTFDPATGALELGVTTLLTREDGVTPLSGLPNLAGTAGFAYADEEPVDLFGNPLALDPFGGDLEGVAVTTDGSVWMCDEYRPALYKFNAAGVLQARYVPVGSSSSTNTGIEALPAVYAQRRANRGFEGLAAADGRLYAFIQSPLDNPDTANDASSKASIKGRILVFDPATATTVAEYLYVFDGGASDKIGDAVALGNGRFFVIERDSSIGAGTAKRIYKVDLAGATNLALLPASIVGPGGSLELMSTTDLELNGIVPASKSIVGNLSDFGFDAAEKLEGLAIIDGKTLAIVNDNDFGIGLTFNPATGLLDPNPAPPPVLFGLVRLAGPFLDASDKDSAIALRNWPVKGLYMPDAISAFRAQGQQWLVTVNEGDTRDWDAFSDEARVSTLGLDPVAFPGATDLKLPKNLGRLTVSTVDGDTDDDGDFDALYVFGGRSVSIWTTDGELAWDSEDLLESLTAELLPSEFNSDNTANASFDTRSDNKGPEPEGVTVAKLFGKTWAFVALERVGGVLALDVSDPLAPTVAAYVNSRDFTGDPESGTAGDLGPEGVFVIPQQQSPTGEPLLVVSFEISGSVGLFRIAPAP